MSRLLPILLSYEQRPNRQGRFFSYSAQQAPAAAQHQPGRERPEDVDQRAHTAAEDQLHDRQHGRGRGQDVERQPPLRRQEPDHAAELQRDERGDREIIDRIRLNACKQRLQQLGQRLKLLKLADGL